MGGVNNHKKLWWVRCRSDHPTVGSVVRYLRASDRASEQQHAPIKIIVAAEAQEVSNGGYPGRREALKMGSIP